MIGLDIITGFLGAGKTTLINKLLAQAYAGQRVAVVENEFGEIGIDGSLIAASDDKLRVQELSNGCICCTLKGDFLAGLSTLIEDFAPERIIIEPTGLARTDDLIGACRNAEENHGVRLESVTTVVSAPLVPALIGIGGEILHEQIADARFIALSDVQGLGSDDPDVAGIIALIRTLNPEAAIHAEPWDDSDGLALLGMAEAAFDAMAAHGHAHEHEHGEEDEEDELDGFSSVAVQTAAPASPELLARLTEACDSGRFGQVLRAKALLGSPSGPVHYDYVLGKADSGPVKGGAAAATDGRVVVIGRGLDAQAIREFIEQAGERP